MARAGSTKAARIGSSSPGWSFLGRFQRSQPLLAHLVHATTEDLVDQVFLATEVVVDRGDVDVGAARDLPERSAGEAELSKEFLGGAEDPVLGGEGMRGGHSCGRFNGWIQTCV
jgi:hypothetical protein